MIDLQRNWGAFICQIEIKFSHGEIFTLLQVSMPLRKWCVDDSADINAKYPMPVELPLPDYISPALE